jgi:hypothetical protein
MMGCDGRYIVVAGNNLATTNQTAPYETDHIRCLASHYMPGYYHFVPTDLVVPRSYGARAADVPGACLAMFL